MSGGVTQHSVGKHTMVSPNILKPDMLHHSKPNTLIGLCGLAQAIDAHYWECKAKISHKTSNPGSSSTKPSNKPNPKPDSHSGNNSSQSKNNPGLTQTKKVLLSRRNPPLTSHRN